MRWRRRLGSLVELAVTAIGRDRPGIVAAISGALFDLGGNIEDSQMSILRGHFAVMLMVRVPDDVSRDQLAERLGRVRDDLGLEAITFNDVDELRGPPSGATHVLTVYGADHPGIVRSVTATLAERDVNITDLETRVTEGERPIYAMIMELALAEDDVSTVEEALREVGEREQVEVSLRQLDTETL
jgi:glycine cleavage system transcriptional repressor